MIIVDLTAERCDIIFAFRIKVFALHAVQSQTVVFSSLMNVQLEFISLLVALLQCYKSKGNEMRWEEKGTEQNRTEKEVVFKGSDIQTLY